MLMVAGIRIISFIMVIHLPIPFAQRGASCNGLSELEVDGTRHLHGFHLHDLCKAQEILNGECGQAFVLHCAMAGKPSNHCSGVFLVLDIGGDQI